MTWISTSSPSVSAPDDAAGPDRRRYGLRPIVVDATMAHTEGVVTYEPNGVARVRHPDLPTLAGASEVVVPLDRQKPLILHCLTDLGKALAHTANSPVLEDGESLRDRYEREYAHYLDLAGRAYDAGRWAADYGTYVYDQVEGVLYTIAPEFWHRLGLVTSTGKLLSDPDGALTWSQIRAIFDQSVVGVAGASVGSNVLEGITRDVRPKRLKIADPDWLEITNLNRLERASLRHLGGSRAQALDPRDPFAQVQVRMNKAEALAYELHLVDPYAQIWVYADGLHADNLAQLLAGDGRDEPGLDVLLEEMDHPERKLEARARCRELRIPVLMLSDFGDRPQARFQDFRRCPEEPLGFGTSDAALWSALERALTTGNRDDFFAFVGALCGSDFAADEFAAWVRGEGEQPTSSVPQSGATAMASGAIAGKMIALHLLGHAWPGRVTFDLRHASVRVEPGSGGAQG